MLKNVYHLFCTANVGEVITHTDACCVIIIVGRYYFGQRVLVPVVFCNTEMIVVDEVR